MKNESAPASVQDFEKYEKRGAYHWDEMKPSWKITFNPYLHARYHLTLQQIQGDGAGKVAVDMGCGDGFVLSKLSERGYGVIGIDGSPDGIAIAKNRVAQWNRGNVQFEVGNVCSTALADCSADLVLSLDVIEHLDSPELLVKEMVRIAKPGAKILIGTPVRFTEDPLDKFHTREFFPAEFSAYLSKYLEVGEVLRSHPVEFLALMQRKFSFFGKKKNLAWNLINLYFLITGRNPLLETTARFPTYQLAICTKR